MKYVVISLDTELGWGRLSSDKHRELISDPTAGREAIDYALDAFDTHGITGTWALVGHLLLDYCEHDTHPTPPYITSLDPFTSVDEDPLYYYPDLVDKIEKADVDHEIAGHSFAHPSFSDLSREQARTELSTMMEMFDERGYDIESLVHPRIDLAHTDILSEFGISTYSEKNQVGNYTLKQGARTILRFDKTIVDAPLVEPWEDENGLCVLPRSRSLRDERWGWLNPLRVKRALRRPGDGLLHLTFHPHNLLYDRFLRWSLPKVLEIVAEAERKGEVSVETFRSISP